MTQATEIERRDNGTKLRDLARTLKRDADRYPDERGNALLDAAEAWMQVGDNARAVGLLDEARSSGGEAAEYAAVQVAEVSFRSGRHGEALAHLERLRSERPSWPGPCGAAGATLAQWGDHGRALAWFNMAVSRLDDSELAALRTEVGWATHAAHVVQGRRDVREALGFPPDELDRAVPEPPRVPGLNAFPSTDDASQWYGERFPPEVRVLFWPGKEFYAANERWPEVFGGAGHSSAEYHAELETRWRAMSERGAQRVTLVPGTADGLAEFAARTGGDPGDERTRRAYMEELYASGARVSWPPRRNDRCWCGSAAKYKKCCGNPASR